MATRILISTPPSVIDMIDMIDMIDLRGELRTLVTPLLLKKRGKIPDNYIRGKMINWPF